MRLYAPTEMLRRTLPQEAAVVLDRHDDGEAPEGSFREVQFLVPDGNRCFAAIDQPVQSTRDNQDGIGPNRDYKMCEIPSGQSIKFRLLPHQFLIASSSEGLVMATLIVEHCEE